MLRIFFVILLMLFNTPSWSQETIFINYIEPSTSNELKLESFVYEPRRSNGKTIIFSHGSTGGNKSVIKESIRFNRIGKIASDQGYRMIVFMRKGRGNSEGTYTEESGRCDRSYLNKEVAEAYSQLLQVSDWAVKKYGTEKLIFAGHSRGGFLSSYFASRHPERSIAAVSIAGVWSAICENKNGGFSRDMFTQSSEVFKNQYWAYFEDDSYFGPDRFDDEDYTWFSSTASKKGIPFKKYPRLDLKDGHATGTWRPEIWSKDVFAWLDRLH